MSTDIAPPTSVIDLHTHTNASDGLDTPAELVANAARQGLSVLGITDHDTVAALDDAAMAASGAGMTLVPGVELSTSVDKAEVHVLGYFVDRHDPSLRDRLNEFTRARVRRVERMIERFHELGYPIDGDEILSHADQGSIGRPHVARALIAIGASTSVNDAFERFLKPGRPGFIPRDPFLPEDAVRLLVEHSAIPVLAHPFTTNDIEGILKRLVPVGLQGFETYYAEYSPEEHRQLRAIADAWGLIPTGGSDYHGLGFKQARVLGSAPVPNDVFERLADLHASMKAGS